MDYQNKLQKLLLSIPRGKVTTYKEVAGALGTRGYRFIGQLLNRNPHPDKYPCYKVVASDGRLSGFALGQTEKVRRLKADGIEIEDGLIKDFSNKLHRF